MGSYRIEWKHSALKELKKITLETVSGIIRSVDRLCSEGANLPVNMFGCTCSQNELQALSASASFQFSGGFGLGGGYVHNPPGPLPPIALLVSIRKFCVTQKQQLNDERDRYDTFTRNEKNVEDRLSYNPRRSSRCGFNLSLLPKRIVDLFFHGN